MPPTPEVVGGIRVWSRSVGHRLAAALEASSRASSSASETSPWPRCPESAREDHCQPVPPSWWSMQPSLSKYLMSSGKAQALCGDNRPPLWLLPLGARSLGGLPREHWAGRAGSQRMFWNLRPGWSPCKAFSEASDQSPCWWGQNQPPPLCNRGPCLRCPPAGLSTGMPTATASGVH